MSFQPSNRLIGLGRTAEILAYKPGQVLKLFFDWCPHSWAELEADLTEKAFARGLPAPRVYGLHEQDGRLGIIMDHINGASMLTMIRKHPLRLHRYANLLADLQYSLNQNRLSEASELISGLKVRIGNSRHISDSIRDVVVQSLDRLKEDSCLCHMDFHPDNVLLTDEGPVIIDWSNLCLAAPTADVARSRLIMSVGNPPPGTPGLWLINLIRRQLINSYVRRYLSKKSITRKELDSWILPLAVVRLDEDIKSERDTLLGMIESLAQQCER